MQFGAQRESTAFFSLPPEDPGNPAVLAAAQGTDGGEGSTDSIPGGGAFRIGLSTWGNKAYRGTIYPATTQPRDYLAAYGRLFSTVELSSTFYGMPPEDRLADWAAAVPTHFRFLPKISRTITHRRRLGDSHQALQDFAAAISILGLRLGPLFLQLPPTFAPGGDNLLRLSKALGVLGAGTAVELRHPDWFRTPVLQEVASVLRETKAIWVVTDTPGAREFVDGVLASSQFVLRLVSTGFREVDYLRVDLWIERLGSWFAAGLTGAFVYIHYDDPVGALGLLERFAAGLAGKARVVGAGPNPGPGSLTPEEPNRASKSYAPGPDPDQPSRKMSRRCSEK